MIDKNKRAATKVLELIIEHKIGDVLINIDEFRAQPGVFQDEEAAQFAVDEGLLVQKKVLLYLKEYPQYTSFFFNH